MVHSTILSLSADYPLVSQSQTSLEKGHAALVLNIAHEADFIMGLRLLDTGTARDVSGVLRISIRDSIEQNGQNVQKQMEEKEVLYFVGGDGGVKVFERGQ
jgi:elongator complex protein 6